MTASSHGAAERVARQSYGRLLAMLVRLTRDIATAEDALAGAFEMALRTWPGTGPPDNPQAWLLTTARRLCLDGFRHRSVRDAAQPTLDLLAGIAQDEVDEATGPLPDSRLNLLFVCAHPAIDASVHTALMLQTVLGLDAHRIAQAFLVKGPAIGQQLARAKHKIRASGIAFELPDAQDLPARLPPVRAAIYAAFTTAWRDTPAGERTRTDGLTGEALFLAGLLAHLLPDDAESRGLHALLLYCSARDKARQEPGKGYVPLSAQDPRHWDHAMIDEAEAQLKAAVRIGRPGRLQTEAAIQSVHCQRRLTGITHHDALARLYDALVQQSPSLGAAIGRAMAHGNAGRPGFGLDCLARLPQEQVAAYQPFWAARAHLHARMDRTDQARADFTRAIALTDDAAVAAWLAQQLGALPDSG